MLIHIDGNIASGKTSVGQLVSAALGIPLVSLDDMRRLHSDGSWDGERRALAALLDKSRDEPDLVVDMISSNRRFEDLLDSHRDVVFTILLHCPPEVCRERAIARSARGYVYPPVPWAGGRAATDPSRVFDSIKHLARDVELMEHDYTYDTTVYSAEEIARRIVRDLQGGLWFHPLEEE